MSPALQQPINASNDAGSSSPLPSAPPRGAGEKLSFLLTITEQLKVGQRKRRAHRFVVLATSETTVVSTFALTHETWLIRGADVTVEAYAEAVIALPQ